MTSFVKYPDKFRPSKRIKALHRAESGRAVPLRAFARFCAAPPVEKETSRDEDLRRVATAWLARKAA